MTKPYAANTAIQTERTQEQIDRALIDAGIDPDLIEWRTGAWGARVIWQDQEGLIYTLSFAMPPRSDYRFQYSPTGRVRYGGARSQEEWRKENRRRWRSLLLYIRARLEAITSEIELDMRHAFADKVVVTGAGQTVGELALAHADKVKALGLTPQAVAGLLPEKA